MNKGYCENCDKLVNYVKKEIDAECEIKNKKYSYKRIVCYCEECKEEISVNEISDENLNRIDDAYRTKENIIKVNQINEIIRKYKIGKKPLSKLLGWGEVTLIRYLNGDVPTKPYSDELFKILNNYEYMKELLEKNKNNITDKTYKDVIENIKLIDSNNEFVINSDIELISEYIIQFCNEITPLALQKVLYYAQGFYRTFFGEFLFKEDCQAWVHGPVYVEIYNKYKEYKYSNIPIYMNYDVSDMLDEEKKELLDVVIKCFGYYNGKALEKMSHFEMPWINARKGLPVTQNSNNIIKKQDIEEYFDKIIQKYDMLSILDIKKYSEEHFNRVIGI